MEIPQQYAHKSVYHITNIENLPSILQHGLLSKNKLKNLGLENKNIAYEHIQKRRTSLQVPIANGGNIHDYVPLYFCKRSPMLQAIVHNKIDDQQFIIYLEFPIQIIEDPKCIFTNFSVNSSITPPFFKEPCDLINLNWEAIDTWKWSNKYDVDPISIKQQKQAEVLFYEKLTLTSLQRIFVWNNEIRKRVESIYSKSKLKAPPIMCDSREGENYYYLDKNNKSQVKGPASIYYEYNKTIERITTDAVKNNGARFQSLNVLLNALVQTMECIPETREIINLKTDNKIHFESVGDHTLHVVDELQQTNEYKQMSNNDKAISKIAAYLHDIGKGPKNRWDWNGGLQKEDPNHPVNGLKMVERILNEEVSYVDKKSSKLICKLVCYHDLIGGILGEGRRIKELEKIVESENELNMLIAISKADMNAINENWVNKNEKKIQDMRERIIKGLNRNNVGVSNDYFYKRKHV